MSSTEAVRQLQYADGQKIVIPARDPVTLDQAGYYFILFPNPAYARAYQNHVIHLHHMARTHTPTSIESPLPLQPGVIVSGQDAFTLLQDYALCPPSQKLQLKLLSPPYSPNTEQLVSQRGYTQLTDGTDRTGRSVLFWVDGRNLTTSMIKHIVVADGRDQGLAWDMSIEQVDTLASTADAANHATAVAYDEFAETEARRCAPPRWILSFSDESMARRFIRVWHRRPFPSARGHEARLVHAEFIW